MKPLTIDELKALQVGDWVWVENEKYTHSNKFYASKSPISEFDPEKNEWFVLCTDESVYTFRYNDYGETWLAYKNKEMAENMTDRYTREDSTYYEQALARLQELENKVAAGELVELPCLRDITGWTSDKLKQKQLLYVGRCGFVNSDVYNEADFAEAERRLVELRGEK